MDVVLKTSTAWSAVQETFFIKYFCSLPDDGLASLPVSVETALLVNLTTKTLLHLLDQCPNTFAVYEKCVADSHIKCYQLCVVVEKMGGIQLSDTIGEAPIYYDILNTINYDVNCNIDLLLCCDVIKETVDNMVKLVNAIQYSKDYVTRLQQTCTLSVHECSVCASTHTMLTKCGHRFCYECFVKTNSIKTECPVCRSGAQFYYIKDNTPDILEIVRTHYKQHELTWGKK
ncbi:hypothetical protein [Mocis latipes granulovirus]|uniref:RING-type domain-containing protein n=1 Tax=Mocis latipes granulovirus TaxID=2072024 RepID=A0A162GWH6_9BBAC|nr:hypothetical protein [Mocis latipes granulovirus]AKR17487.1 hypothetical protein [Mocis latipes granulovirus]